MIREKFLVRRFDPIYLTLDRIGPFQEPKEIKFTNSKDSPCNLFLLMSANGFGKTTILETMAALMNLLGHETIEATGLEDIDVSEGRAQLDLLMEVIHDDKQKTIIYTLCAGGLSPASLKSWDDKQIAHFGAEDRIVHGFEKLSSGRFQLTQALSSSPLAKDMVSAVQSALGERPEEIQDTSLPLPSMLFFSAYRDILPTNVGESQPIVEPMNWGYRPLKVYDRGVRSWTGSPDNLLVWLKWLDSNNGTNNLDRIIRIINQDFFKVAFKGTKTLLGIRPQPPEGIVKNGAGTHRLDRLSSGEKSVLELLLRIPADMTRKTIVLIDELDVHLHPNWERLILIILKRMAAEFPGLTFIFTTHSREMLDVLDHNIPEEGLVKGGVILRKGFN